MSRALDDLADLAARMPWWRALLLGFALYVMAAHLIPVALTDPWSKALEPVLTLFGYALFCVCAVGALAGFITRFRQKRLYDRQASMQQVRSLHWKGFEELIAEAFRREGFDVQLTPAGADGGVDLRLKRQGRCDLVQCKQWRSCGRS